MKLKNSDEDEDEILKSWSQCDIELIPFMSVGVSWYLMRESC